ncbi:MAG: hypothetical protein A3G33_06210 [Omnitrophica bacterium RIFCSPLOWO2_12_FULL_44_17]|uniref:D-alanyl-D-alanine carboxypeptidase-like core domain-containing protein n=1 Tax=Candidatus Danuiimicrobium aquiferis TaxID=1801832 RepID=A0A1G1KR32_9BACT|nr:MAG: hypothetical protein A3B72_02695 [Omnitrophica bacterium RIFCSPHIGHO2_02_FULL_45_28]OGW95377.1 MAG: hypothetical protein A3G33_06210 [Omnitrophica bacterium RIFCSPLOWO2_12_FULL_44_17]
MRSSAASLHAGMTLLVFLLVSCNLLSFAQESPWDILNGRDKEIVNAFLEKAKPLITEKQEKGIAALLVFSELFKGLNEEDRIFLERVCLLSGMGSCTDIEIQLEGTSQKIKFIPIENQSFSKQNLPEKIPTQYLSENVFETYAKMMKRMEENIGTKLLVESGYRSPAYQLYLFLSFLPKHGYSLIENQRWNALPGKSEHGNPVRQAVDFISVNGVNGEENPEDFTALPEYQWLKQNAADFDFELSYPEESKDAVFEPWHWRCIKSQK